MALDWTRFDAAETVFGLTTDPRPAWLWSGDGRRLLWRNRAAALFGARLVGDGLQRVPDPRPIGGQIARIVRLGLLGRTTRSRMQFIAGHKPLSASCSCTAYPTGDETPALLIVAIEPVADRIFAADGAETAQNHALLPAGGDYALLDAEGRIVTATGPGQAAVAAAATLEIGQEPRTLTLDAGTVVLKGFVAGPDDARLFVLAPQPAEETAPDLSDPAPGGSFTPPAGEPDTPQEAPSPPQPEAEPLAAAPSEPRPNEDDRQRLSVLIDKLAADEELFGALADADDTFADPSAEDAGVDSPSEDAVQDLDIAEEPEDPGTSNQLWQVTGRGFTQASAVDDIVPAAPEASGTEQIAAAEDQQPEPEPDAEPAPEEPQDTSESETRPKAPESSSRYNFEELSRILTERVGREAEPEEHETVQAPAVPQSPQQPSQAAPAGALVALSEETLLLNRLPLALLVFRDQEIVFANRAMVELSGYASLSDLRARGLGALIPALEAGESVGPVHSIARQDGDRVAVEAHLQSVSWQGRATLMLSLRAVQPREKGEPGVTAFARLMAGAMGCALVETDASGVIRSHKDTTPPLLSEREIPTDLTGLVAPGARPALSDFLAADRKAGHSRAEIVLEGADRTTEVAVFAHLQANGDPGFLAFVRPRPQRSAPAPTEPYATSSQVLGRVSRDLRRPLNTIIGFSQLIGSETFGPVRNARYLEYAGDIQAAGEAIAALAEEIDEYVRLFEGRLDLQPGDVDLHALLLDCVHRVRGYASAARVLLRSAVSETLPRVRVDAASVSQAVLNLLASAIALAGEGGRIVLSAHREPGGGVSIHVRDHSREPATYTEHFVVFRDGTDRNGEMRQPVFSSIGWTLTRSLAAANALTISLDPASEAGTLMTLVIPPDQIVA